MSSQEQHILLVDDHEFRRLGIEAMLAPWCDRINCSVVGSRQSDAGLSLSDDESWRLALVSVGSGSIRTEKCAKELKLLNTLSKNTPLIVISDLHDMEEVIAALKLGLDGFIPTDITPELAFKACSFILEGGSYFPSFSQRQPKEQKTKTEQLVDETSNSNGSGPGGTLNGLRSPNGKLNLRMMDHCKNDDADDEDISVDTIDDADDEDIPVDTIDDDEICRFSDEAGDLMTARQQEVLNLLCEGQANKVIARNLGMTEATVKVHIRQIMRKLGASNRTQAALFACDNNSH